jgi:D-arabinose 1-dehydrogenase-like Zn-dependent alcohol dehydrogenase
MPEWAILPGEPKDGPNEVIETFERGGEGWLGYACGGCEYCASGWETPCEKQRNTGYSLDGGYAEYAKANARFAGRAPAGVTTYRAVRVSGTRPSDLASVVAVDPTDEKLQLARMLGADHAVKAREQDPVEEPRKLGGAGAVIATAAFEQGYGSLKRGGTLGFVGLPAGNHVRRPIFEKVLNGTRVGLREVFEFHAAGRTRVIYEKRHIETPINDDLRDIDGGQGRRPPRPRLRRCGGAPGAGPRKKEACLRPGRVENNHKVKDNTFRWAGPIGGGVGCRRRRSSGGSTWKRR